MILSEVMPAWLTILIAVFGLVGTIFGIFGVSAYINERMKHKAAKKNQAEDEAEQKKKEEEKRAEEMKHQEYVTELKTIIGTAIAEALSPVNEKLTNIEDDLGKVKRGVQVNCRNDLEELAAKAEHDKFISHYDKKRFESAYQAYHDLGKNGVMDATRERILNMDETKPTTKRKPRAKKQVLSENK